MNFESFQQFKYSPSSSTTSFPGEGFSEPKATPRIRDRFGTWLRGDETGEIRPSIGAQTDSESQSQVPLLSREALTTRSHGITVSAGMRSRLASSRVHLSTMTTTTVPVGPPSPVDPEPIMSMAKIPDWLLTHPELIKRGIVVREPLQPVSLSTPEFTNLPG